MTHTLSCITGSLVIASHKKICDKILYLSQCAFTPESLHAKPLIHQVRTRSEQEIHQGSYKDKETQVDVMIQGLWDKKVEVIIDVKLGNVDTDSYKY